MMAPDYLVEVRDKDFIRVGQIAAEFLNIQFTEVFRGVGSWQLKLPAEHPLLEDLKQPGSGIVITQRSSSRVYSGRTRSAVLSQNSADPLGTWVVSGSDDGIVAAATVVYPDPAAAPDAQSVGYWVFSAAGETVMRDAVRLNAGSTALVARRYPWLSVPASAGLGSTVKVSSRFDVLGDLLTSVAIQANLGWTFYQLGDGVVFDVYAPQDKRKMIRLDIRNGGLESTELGFSAPSATQVLVMGQGEGENRTILPVTTTESVAAALDWGLRWEATKDQRNTDDPDELEAAGVEILSEKGETVHSLKVTPSDAPGQALGADWWLGDAVTVVIDGQETSAIVAQVATSITSAGVIQQATVGDPVGFSWDAKVASKLKDHEQRLGNVENYVEAAGPTPFLMPAGAITQFAGASAPSGWMIADGAVLLRATYPDLFTAIGTTYNTGGESGTQFRLPNLSGRVPVGKSSTDTEFDALGETGGAKTHTLTTAQIPAHSHQQRKSTQALAAGGAAYGLTAPAFPGTSDNAVQTTLDAGGGQAHNNLQPYITLNFIIKL